MHFPSLEGSGFASNTLIDGEIVLSKDSHGNQIIKYLAFDCLCYEEKSLISRPYIRRSGYLRLSIDKPYREYLSNRKEHHSLPFSFEVKEIFLSYKANDVLLKTIPKLKHISDGLIFTAQDKPYVLKTDENVLKWKSPEQNTVDFVLSMELGTLGDGTVDYEAMPTFNLRIWLGDLRYKTIGTMTISDSEWQELKAKNEPLDDRIVECYHDSADSWRFMRFRDDKEHANHVKTYEKILTSIRDGVTQKELIEACKTIETAWKKRHPVPSSSHRPNNRTLEQKTSKDFSAGSSIGDSSNSSSNPGEKRLPEHKYDEGPNLKKPRR